MPKLSDLLLVSDVDGTVLDADGIPPQNVEAVRRFTEKGGRFTLATGRPLSMARLVMGHFAINAPLVLANGALIYDAQADRLLAEHPLEKAGARRLAGTLAERFGARAGVMMVGESRYYAVSPTAYGQQICMRNILGNPQTAKIEEVPGEIFKMQIMADMPESMPALREEVGALCAARYNVVISGDCLIEIMPKGIDKGQGVMELAALLGIERKNVVAIGDNENDLDMLRWAGYAAVPSGAADFVRSEADRVLCSCGDGALAMLIEYLEHTYESTGGTMNDKQ